ncbi:RagB/SusD family nutrient uptake outer membrane protein [Mucilaginibacter aquatilis]|uniref:RagB/SusD family nutrient uptake outer membrane protein n=1 Tax=Mucilaginibacter aquatilis TaxID=1517760 RepID=A0A6I4I5X3_9SPHI|nr:RagB/SusD family nutrient uptake outer membrane protein [Mucilaginibacter aquatilis]MVN90595.1 RagB/SusD family nutrient uptake outer membrane protein [Mucilaginibacter aquatilis]
MKKIFTLIFCVLALLCGSCKKFLDQKPYSLIAPENFFKSANDAELAITGVYDVMNAPSIQGYGNQALWGRGMHYLTNLGVDDLTQDVRYTTAIPDLMPFYDYTYTADNPNLWYAYFSLYAGINRANFVIERVPTIDMNATRRAQIVGEAQYMRGMFYCYLAWLWGGVPVTTSTNPEITTPRLPVQRVLQQAEADFKAAYNVLPARSTIIGRVNKYTAAGFLAKLYLYEASCKQNNVSQSLNFALNSFDWVNASEAYTQALNWAKDVYDNSGYKLIRPFNYLFLAATEAAARDENMMIVQAGTGGSQEIILFSYLAGPRGNYRTNSGTYGWLRPHRETYLRYNANDGRISTMSGYLNTTTNFTTINGFKYYTPEPISTSTIGTLCVNKWREDDPNAKLARGIDTFSGETDFAILRFADIILMYAEAKFQTGDEAGARALLREIRLRACGDDVAKTTTVTTAYFKTDFMTELLDERGRELLAEGWRRFDLIRTGRIRTVLNGLSTGNMFPGHDINLIKANFQDYKIWYPIPSRDIATNTNLVQNPGY